MKADEGGRNKELDRRMIYDMHVVLFDGTVRQAGLAYMS